jgi:hypothetical protein
VSKPLVSRDSDLSARTFDILVMPSSVSTPYAGSTRSGTEDLAHVLSVGALAGRRSTAIGTDDSASSSATPLFQMTEYSSLPYWTWGETAARSRLGQQ